MVRHGNSAPRWLSCRPRARALSSMLWRNRSRLRAMPRLRCRRGTAARRSRCPRSSGPRRPGRSGPWPGCPPPSARQVACASWNRFQRTACWVRTVCRAGRRPARRPGPRSGRGARAALLSERVEPVADRRGPACGAQRSTQLARPAPPARSGRRRTWSRVIGTPGSASTVSTTSPRSSSSATASPVRRRGLDDVVDADAQRHAAVRRPVAEQHPLPVLLARPGVEHPVAEALGAAAGPRRQGARSRPAELRPAG